MTNETMYTTAATTVNATLPLTSQAPPPPYSVNDRNDSSLPTSSSSPQLSNTNRSTEQTVQQPSNVSSLQLKMITSSVDNWQSTPYECSCVLEDRFLLLGYYDGLQLLDLQQTEKKPTTIIWIRARKMVVMESCRLVLVVAGRHKQVRCYSYDALLRLIYAVLRLDWDKRRDVLYDVPTFQQWEHVATQTGKLPEATTPDSAAIIDDTSLASASSNTLNLKERLAKIKDEKANTASASNTSPLAKEDHQQLILNPAGLSKPYYTYKKVVLQDLYYKLPESRDALSMQTYQTSTYVFVAIRHRDKIVLWQRKRDHPLRPFYRLQVFWIPADAKAISFADDRNTLRHIIAVFSTEATAIDLRDSKVKTVPIDPTLERIYQTTWIRDQYEHQLSCAKSPANSPIPTSTSTPSLLFSRHHPPISDASDNTTSPSPFPSLPPSLSAPPIQWTFLVQLPFYPDSLPATTLTTEYSIPPSYATVVTSLPSHAPPDPVALPSAAAPQLFFATLGKQSYIIDLSGALFSTQVYRWSEVPAHIEFVQLDANVNDWSVIGFGSETVEIINMNTAHTVQRVMHGVPVKFLGRWDESVVPRQGCKKNKFAFKSIFWSCAANERIHVYMLKTE